MEEIATAYTDALPKQERPPTARPATKHLRTAHRTISASVLKTLISLTTEPKRAKRLPPLVSAGFRHRATIRPRKIVRASDGQLILTALLGP